MTPVIALKQDLLLDTHIVLWLAIEPERLPAFVIEAILSAAHRYVSHISALEIQIKHQKSPDLFDFSLDHYEACMHEFRMEELPLAYTDIRRQNSMQFLHNDPFDRLLMAQSFTRNLRLVTQDRDIVNTSHQFREFQVLTA